MCAENAAAVEQLIGQGCAQFQPLAIASTYAASKRTQVKLLHCYCTIAVSWLHRKFLTNKQIIMKV